LLQFVFDAAIVAAMNKKQRNFVLEERKQSAKEAGKFLSLAKAVLVIVGDIAGITISSFFPHPYYHAFCGHRKNSFRSTLYRLQKSGLVKHGGDGGQFFTLTEKGEKERNNILYKLDIEKGKLEKWDGRWRVLIFDIPEKYRKYRKFLRTELIDYGFEPLQKSVWVSPYRVSENLKDAIEELGIEKWAKIMVADALFDEEELKRKFKLS